MAKRAVKKAAAGKNAAERGMETKSVKAEKKNAPAAEETVKSEAKAAPKAVKSEVKAEPKAVKSEVKAEPKAAKSEVKAEPKTVKSEDKAAPKAVKSAAKTAPKAEPKVEVYLQFEGREVLVDEVVNAARADFHGEAQTVRVYLKPEDCAAYYVADGVSGRVGL